MSWRNSNSLIYLYLSQSTSIYLSHSNPMSELISSFYLLIFLCVCAKLELCLYYFSIIFYFYLYNLCCILLGPGYKYGWWGCLQVEIILFCFFLVEHNIFFLFCMMRLKFPWECLEKLNLYRNENCCCLLFFFIIIFFFFLDRCFVVCNNNEYWEVRYVYV